MIQNYSKTRQQAEIAFGKAQSQFLARTSALEDRDASVVARENKTLRLREARLAKELRDTLSSPA
jgi:hypothetical protein